jgi:hypothetical protein
LQRRMQLLLATLGVALVCPSFALALTTAPGYQASDYVTGFPFANCCSWGPLGVAFDTSDNLYVSDYVDHHLYRFQPGGGTASSATQLNGGALSGGLKGLAFARGHLYLARSTAGDVVEIDQATGAVTRRVAGGMSCPTGLATDPISGDLFVSQVCANALLRISGLSGGPVHTSTYAATAADGIAFAPDGTLYAASGGHLLEIGGTNSSTPGLTRSVAIVASADGIGVGAGPSSRDALVLLVNRTDGNVTRVDFSKTPPAQQDVVTGGSRGDFVAVNSQGCLFITQTSSIVKVVPPGNHCDLTPSTPGSTSTNSPPPGIKVDTLPPTGRRGCVVKRRLVVRVRQRGRVRLRYIRVYVNGRYRKTVRHRRVSAPIVIRFVPRGKFTVKLVARTTKGRKLTAKRRYKNCPRR